MKTLVFWMVIVVSAFLLWQTVKSGGSAQAVPEISYSEFLARVASGQVSKVTIAGSVVRGSDAKGGSFRVIVPFNQAAMVDALQQHGVEVWFKETSEQSWPSWILNLVAAGSAGRTLVFHDPPDATRRSGGDGAARSNAHLRNPNPALARDFCHFPLFPRFLWKRSKMQEG